MSENNPGVKLNITDCSVSFESIYNADTTPQEYIEQIKEANVLIIPNNNRYGEKGVHFPETTREFYHYLKQKNTDGMIADIAISDSEFQMLEMHSDFIVIATMIVTNLVFPVVSGLITNFIYDKLKSEHKNPEEVVAKLEIIVEDKKNRSNKRISYEGPTSEIQNVLNETNKLLRNASKNNE